jgi:hypothetical protein
MRSILTIIVFSLCPFFAGAQSLSPEVIGSAGAHFAANNVQLSWTIGETSITTISDGTNTLTQGFHQTNLTVTSVVNQQPDFRVNVFPVPVTDQLTVQFSNAESDLTLVLIGAAGQLLENRLIPAGTPFVELSMLGYAAGAYGLRVSTNEGTTQSFKIIKTH